MPLKDPTKIEEYMCVLVLCVHLCVVVLYVQSTLSLPEIKHGVIQLP